MTGSLISSGSAWAPRGSSGWSCSPSASRRARSKYLRSTSQMTLASGSGPSIRARGLPGIGRCCVRIRWCAVGLFAAHGTRLVRVTVVADERGAAQARNPTSALSSMVLLRLCGTERSPILPGRLNYPTAPDSCCSRYKQAAHMLPG